MPFVRVSLLEGKDGAYHAKISDSIYEAMMDTFDVPKGDKFIVFHEHKPGAFYYGKDYLGIERTDGLLMIQVTCNNTRTVDQKRKFYAAIAAILHRDLSIRTEDIFISLVEVPKENWSFGQGLAQYAIDIH